MYFEINVTHKGKHLFATAERSLQDRDKMEKLYKLMREKFPYNDGYEVWVTRWDTVGTREY